MTAQAALTVPPPEAEAGPRAIRVFVASPGDVDAERQEVEAVVRGLNETFAQIVRLATVRWEERSYTAETSFQDQIPEAKDCDVVVAIFGNKLGSPLRADFPHCMADGQPYASGTAYEVLSALAASAATKRPAVYAFCKTTKPAFGLDERAAFDAALRERARVDTFVAQWFETPDGASQRAVRPFATLATFQQEVRRALTDWIQAEILGGRKPVWQIETEGSPFRALEPFDARHARVFFGRDRKVARAMKALTETVSDPEKRPFLLVVGASGAGKSSLVRAGLVPRLTAPGIVPGVDLWRVAVMRPGADASPQLTLARRLLAASADDPGGFGPALPELAAQGFGAPQHLADILGASPDAAAAILTTALETAAAAAQRDRKFEQPLHANLLLVVDQFEELFADTVTDAQRAAFAALLISLTWSRRIWVVATLRADLFARIIANRGLLELKDTGAQYDLASPGLDELAEILHRSAADTGLDYERDEQTGERLDERLLADATGADTLPLLQFALNELFLKRRVVEEDGRRKVLLTYAAYQEMGGLDGVINSVAERALADPQNALDAREIEAELPRLLRSLVVRVHADRITAGAQATLTIRTAPLGEAQSEDGLIRALRNARILLTSDVRASVDGKLRIARTMRIAHERVLASWVRAKAIVDQHLEYFRIAEDLDGQMRRWEERGKPRDLLLPHGSLLADAEVMRRQYGSELSPVMQDYIRASFGRERLRQGLRAGVTAVVGLLAAAALLFGITAAIALRQAAGNYTAAKDAADQLVTSVGQDMRDLDGVNVKTLNTVFGVVQDLVGRIKQAVAAHDAGVPRAVQPFVGAIASIMGGQTGGAGDLNGLEGRMLWETAETYHKFNSDTPAAMQDAKRSLVLRQQMWDAGDRSQTLQWELGLSHRLLGDLSRIAAQQGGADLKAARAHYDQALGLFNPLYTLHPDLDHGLGVTTILSRLGDLDTLEHDSGSARTRYAMERAISQAVFLKDTADVRARRELGWAFRKMGDYWFSQKQFAPAQDEFTREVCVRRAIADSNTAQTLWQQDLGWSLMKLAAANLNAALGAPARDALFEAFAVRQRLALRDPNNATWQSEYAATLQVLATYYNTSDNPLLALEFSMSEVQARRQAEAAAGPQGSHKATEAAEQRLQLARQGYGGDPADITEQRAAQDIVIELRSVNRQQQGVALAAAQNCWGALLRAMATDGAGGAPQEGTP